MAVIKTKVNARSTEFIDNSEYMQAEVNKLNQLIKKIELGGGEARQQRHQANKRHRVHHVQAVESAQPRQARSTSAQGSPSSRP